jgi:hypothetical protein
MSFIVFAQLSLAVIRGSANHVVAEVEDTKDGHAAWQAPTAWYEESDLVVPRGKTLSPPTEESKKEQRVHRKTPEMKKKDKKRIHFHL